MAVVVLNKKLTINLQRQHTILLNFRAVFEKVSSVDLYLWIAKTFKLKFEEVISIEVHHIVPKMYAINC